MTERQHLIFTLGVLVRVARRHGDDRPLTILLAEILDGRPRLGELADRYDDRQLFAAVDREAKKT